MSKMDSHDPFGHFKHNLWSLKVGNCLDLLACRWRATYRWKALDEGYNFALNLILIESLHTKLCAPKVATKIAGVPGQNDIWVLVLWPST
jgi:hypothetical protein